MSKFFVTTPIYYINDKAHIGHAYTTIAADVLARYHREQGHDVLFSTGTDENSQKTVQAAEKNNQDIKEYTDKMAIQWQQTWTDLNISYDSFIRTTEADHKKATYELFSRIKETGDIYEGEYEGLYCTGCEEFKKESDLVNGKCPDHNKVPDLIKEKNYFFKLSKYGDQLLEYIKDNPKFIYPDTRRNEVVSFIEQGLEDISISRETSSWGIPFPFDESHVIYVWAEALINYLTVTGYPDQEYKKWWPADVHLVGKDIIKFHCVIWPAMLMSAGLPLPKSIVAHGFFNVEGTKISKSLGNAINPLELTKVYGNDALRYILLRSVPFGEDGDFTMKHFDDLYNSDLANDLGNLVQRVSSMISKYQDGKIGDIPESSHDNKPFEKAMSQFRFDRALEHIWSVVRSTNQYIDTQQPWKVAKEDSVHLQEILSYTVSNIMLIARLVAPFMPDTAEKIATVFGSGVVDKGVGILFPKIDD